MGLRTGARGAIVGSCLEAYPMVINDILIVRFIVLRPLFDHVEICTIQENTTTHWQVIRTSVGWHIPALRLTDTEILYIYWPPSSLIYKKNRNNIKWSPQRRPGMIIQIIIEFADYVRLQHERIQLHNCHNIECSIEILPHNLFLVDYDMYPNHKYGSFAWDLQLWYKQNTPRSRPWSWPDFLLLNVTGQSSNCGHENTCKVSRLLLYLLPDF